jgi:hypothetical protein
MRNQEYIEFETLEKQCHIKTAKTIFYKHFAHNLPIFLIGKYFAEHWDLPNTGIFYSKDVVLAMAAYQYMADIQNVQNHAIVTLTIKIRFSRNF